MDASHQKLAKFIPPSVEFKGDLTKMKILYKIPFNFYQASKLQFFKGYILLNTGNGIALLEHETYKIKFRQEFETDAIITVNKIDEDNLVIAAIDKIRIIKFEEKQPNNFTYEIIQEICDIILYYAGLILSNDLLLVAGEDQKFVFLFFINLKNITQTKN